MAGSWIEPGTHAALVRSSTPEIYSDAGRYQLTIQIAQLTTILSPWIVYAPEDTTQVPMTCSSYQNCLNIICNRTGGMNEYTLKYTPPIGGPRIEPRMLQL